MSKRVGSGAELVITVYNVAPFQDFRVIGLIHLNHADDDLSHVARRVLLHVEAIHVKEHRELARLDAVLLALLVAQLQVRLQLLDGVPDNVTAADHVQQSVHVHLPKGNDDNCKEMENGCKWLVYLNQVSGVFPLTWCSVLVESGQTVDDVVLQWLRLWPFVNFIQSPAFAVLHVLSVEERK